MSDTWPIADLQIIGGHVCPRPPAPFGRGPAVVRRADDEDAVMIAHRLTAREASGAVIPAEMWRSLCASFESIALASPVAAAADVAVWVFTTSFGEPLRPYETELGDAIIAAEGDADRPGTRSGSRVVVVNERRVKHLRKVWCDRAYNLARGVIVAGQFDTAELHAARCFSLLPSPGAREFGLLSFIAERLGRFHRSEALLDAAGNTGGAGLRELARAHREELARLHPDRPATSGPETRASRPGRLRLIGGSNG